MKNYLKNWSYKRLIQLGIGIFLIYYYIQDSVLFALIFGILMLVQALLNIGCFSTKGCKTSFDEEDKKEFAKDIKPIKK